MYDILPVRKINVVPEPDCSSFLATIVPCLCTCNRTVTYCIYPVRHTPSTTTRVPYVHRVPQVFPSTDPIVILTYLQNLSYLSSIYLSPSSTYPKLHYCTYTCASTQYIMPRASSPYDTSYGTYLRSRHPPPAAALRQTGLN